MNTAQKRKKRSGLNSLNSPQTLEYFNNARINIDYSIIKEKGGKVITITSALQSEGKTGCASFLALSFAQLKENRVLIIDCDLHAPRVHRFFNVQQQPGLSDYFVGKAKLSNCVFFSEEYNLYVMPSGTKTLAPTIFFSSKNFQEFVNMLSERFDYIILDTPPVLMVSDAISFASYTDGVVLVTRANQSKSNELKEAISFLELAHARVLGVILNDVEVSKSGYAYRYGYGRKPD